MDQLAWLGAYLLQALALGFPGAAHHDGDVQSVVTAPPLAQCAIRVDVDLPDGRYGIAGTDGGCAVVKISQRSYLLTLQLDAGRATTVVVQADTGNRLTEARQIVRDDSAFPVLIDENFRIAAVTKHGACP